MRTQPKQIDAAALLKTEHHPVTRAMVNSAIDSTAKGDSVARRRFQNPKPYMNRTKTLWKATVADFEFDSSGVEGRKRREITLAPTRTTTFREAKRILQPILDKANAQAFNPIQEKKCTTFEEFVSVWERDYLSLSKPSTIATMKGHVRRLKGAFGPQDMRTIDPADLQRFVSNLSAEEYAPKTIRNFWITIRLIWSAALAQGYIEAMPAKPKLPRVFRKKPRCFSLEEVGKILAASHGVDHWLYWLAAETGLRSGELEGLTPHSVLIDGITVNGTVWNGIGGEPKTPNSVRTVAVSASLSRELTRLAFDRMDAGREYLFDHCMDYHRKKHLQPLLKQLGIQSAGFHAFRHFKASLTTSHPSQNPTSAFGTRINGLAHA